MPQMDSILLKEVAKFINFLDKLSEEEKLALKVGELKIKYSTIRDANASEKKVDCLDIGMIVEKLKSLNTREETNEYLNLLALKRDSLERIIRELDLPYNKKDRIDKMKEKIVEGIVGFRLRSEAIQSNSLF